MNINLDNLFINNITLIEEPLKDFQENELINSSYVQSINVAFPKELFITDLSPYFINQAKNIDLEVEERTKLKYPKAFYQGFQAGLLGIVDSKKKEGDK